MRFSYYRPPLCLSGEQVLNHCGGYIYYVSLKGVTGSATLDTDDVAIQVQAIKAEPICRSAWVLVSVMRPLPTRSVSMLMGLSLVVRWYSCSRC